jgi:transglutaminase-like putative cysteine protease
MRRFAAPLALIALSLLAACAHPGRPPATATSPALPPKPVKAVKGHDELPATAHVFLYKVDVVLDDAARETRTIHRRYRIDDASAADQGWGSTGCEWSAWRDEKPELHVTVDAPDGTRRELDPKTIEDATASGDDASAYSDRRVLRAPLPAIEPGSIVDETIVTRTKQATAPRAVGRFELLGDPAGADRLEISVDAPDGLPFAWKLMGDSGPVEDAHASGRRHVTLARKDFRRDNSHESWLPDDVAPVPYLRFATGASWRDLAAYYTTLVDGALSAARLGEKARAAVFPGDDTRAKVTKLAELVQHEVRYVGLEFGASAIVPHSPAETQQRRYGDCKDQATLLVGLLREVGIDANVALLDAGGADVDPSLPSLDAFDHAITYVPGESPLWVDTTVAEVRPGDLPMADEGRLALIVSPKTRELVRTPESSAGANVYRERREVWIPEEGRARIVETDELSGLVEADMRRRFSTPASAKRENVEPYVKQVYGADALGAFAIGDAIDRSKPFTLKYEAVGSRRGVSNDDTAEFIVEDAVAFGYIPESILKKERAVGAKLGYAHRSELEILVHAPDVFEAAPPPAGEQIRLGPATLTRSYDRLDAQTLRAKVVFELPRRALSAEDLGAMREGIAEYRKKDSVRLRFPAHAATLEAEGRSPEALALLRARAEGTGASFVSGRRYVNALIRLGFIGEARKAASRLSAAWPAEEQATVLDASLRLRDDLGRLASGDVNYDAGMDFLRRAAARKPKAVALNLMLGFREMQDSAGRITMKRPNLERARAALEAWEREADADAVKRDSLLPLTLLRLDDLAAARAEANRRSTEIKNGLLLVLAAIDGGTAGAKRALDELDVKTHDRATALGTAAATASTTKHYAAAAALRELQAELGASDETQLKLAHALRAGFASDPPDVAAARSFFVDLLFLAGEGRRVDGRATATEVERYLADQLRSATTWVPSVLDSIPIEVLSDMARATTLGQRGRSLPEGELSEVRMTPVTGGAPMIFLVVNDSGHYRVVATADAPMNIVGNAALAELEHGKEARARAMLDWYFAQQEADNAVPTSTAGLVVWRQTGDLRLTIAAMSPGETAASTAALAKAPADSTNRELRIALDSARLFAGSSSGSDDTAAVLARLKRDGASAASLRRYEVRWRTRRGELAEVDRLLGDSSIPASARAQGYGSAAYELAHMGKLADAYAMFLRADALSPLPTGVTNTVAWYGLLAGQGSDRRVLEFARQASADNAAELNTLATIEAGYQEPRKALATIAKWKAAVGRRPMRPSDMLPYALLAERHGLIDEAIRLLEPLAHDASPTGGGAFAKQRLDALRKMAHKG